MCRAIGRHGAGCCALGRGVDPLQRRRSPRPTMAPPWPWSSRPGARQVRPCVRRRDPPAVAGGPADRLGASVPGDSRHLDLRQHGRADYEGRPRALRGCQRDRIAANGDTANKIGTYGLAVLADCTGFPFYVAAPSSTFDLSITDGSSHSDRAARREEVTHGLGRRTAPEGIAVYNPLSTSLPPT